MHLVVNNGPIERSRAEALRPLEDPSDPPRTDIELGYVEPWNDNGVDPLDLWWRMLRYLENEVLPGVPEVR